MNAWAQISAVAELEHARLQAALADARTQQSAFLDELLRTNAATRFGREHGFHQIASVEEFRSRVPIRRADEFAPWLDAVARGEPQVLTIDPPVAFESTSGTASHAKVIPYPEAALRAFRAGVLPWLRALLIRRPRITDGVAYVAASPVGRAARKLPGGGTLGLPSDAAYLGTELLPALSQVIAAPPSSSDIDTWRVRTLAHLARRADLTLISIWSPTFLLELLEALPSNAERVFAELHAAGDASAARRLERALVSHDLREHLWPQLQAVSLWMDGASAPYAQRVASLLPGVHLDAKGVLATESVITVRTALGAVPALTSAFLEFVDDDGGPHLAHELEAGARYRVVLTTPGGLWRYDIGDEFECAGIERGVPRLRFIGRAGIVSDLVGEKLTDSFVAEALAQLPAAASLVPSPQPDPHYELWVDSGEHTGESMARSVEQSLRRNPQYAYARELGQLKDLQVVCAPGFAQHRARHVFERGGRLGDAKSCALLLDRAGLPPAPPGTT